MVRTSVPGVGTHFDVIRARGPIVVRYSSITPALVDVHDCDSDQESTADKCVVNVYRRKDEEVVRV